MTWFPTIQWFEEYSEHINKNRRYRGRARDWGDGWRGDFILHITGVPVDSYHVKDMPDELLKVKNIPESAWHNTPSDVKEVVRECRDDPIHLLLNVLDGTMRKRLPDSLREVLDEADELFDINPTYRETPDMISRSLREFLPRHLYGLLAQLEVFVEDNEVYAYMDLEKGFCKDIDVKTVEGDWDRDEVGYVFHGDFDAWARFTYHGDIIRTIIHGDIEPEGDVSRLLEYSEAFDILGDTVREIDTRYLFGKPI